MLWFLLLVTPALLQAKQIAVSSQLQVFKLHIKSEVYSRFATTNVTSSVLNVGNDANEAVFKVQLPNSAFISYFQMTIDGEVIVGEVKDKDAAKKQYEAAKAKGQSSGLVAQSARETNKFDISINVESKKTVHFVLMYQEILQRVQGAYRHVININPGQIVDNFLVSVSITERRQISLLRVPEPEAKLSDKTNKLLIASKAWENVRIGQFTDGGLHKAQVTYKPNAKEQSAFSTNGLDGLQMVVLYDVERDYSGGELEVVNGYFVHFVAPKGDQLPIGNKHVVFTLDVSGSMSGAKISQMRESMLVILDALQPDDMFNIITFATSVHVKYPESRQASPEAIAEAKVFVGTLQATSSTNIYEALYTGLRILKQYQGETLQSMLIFLTDGEPTVNVTNADEILKGVNSWNNRTQFSIHAISFGDNADYDLLRRISAQNKGVARKVYEDSDANLQLVGFFEEVCSPLLTDLSVKYLNETVLAESVVQDVDNTYYDGAEVVIVGQLNPDYEVHHSPTSDLRGSVSGMSKNGPILIECTTPVPCFDWCPMPVLPPDVCVEDVFDENTTMPNFCHQYPLIPMCRITCPAPVTPRPPLKPLPASSLGGFVERMWAYLTIKKHLRDSKFGNAPTEEKSNLKEKALYLSLKYQFVTELTSMVVTKPDENQTSTDEHIVGESLQDVSGQYNQMQMGAHGYGNPMPPPALSQGSRGRPGPAGDPGLVYDYDNGFDMGMPTHYATATMQAMATHTTTTAPLTPAAPAVTPATPAVTPAPAVAEATAPAEPQYKSSNDMTGFNPHSVYINVTVTSLEECIDACLYSATCQAAVYLPVSVQSVESSVCGLSFVPVNCTTTSTESVSNTQPTLLYCFK